MKHLALFSILLTLWVPANASILDGILHYWKMDESSGNPVDNVGGYTLTNNNVTFSTGIINNGAVFNSTTDSLVKSSPTDLNFTGATPFSIACWTNNTSFSTNPPIVAHLNSTGLFEGYIFQYNSSGGIIWNIGADNGGSNLLYVTAPNGTVTTGLWYHTVLTYDGTKTPAGTHIYVNTVDQTLSTVFNSFTGSSAYAGTFQIGSREANSINYQGTIDECAVWNRVLTSAEVQQLYSVGRGVQWPFYIALPFYWNYY